MTKIESEKKTFHSKIRRRERYVTGVEYILKNNNNGNISVSSFNQIISNFEIDEKYHSSHDKKDKKRITN